MPEENNKNPLQCEEILSPVTSSRCLKSSWLKNATANDVDNMIRMADCKKSDENASLIRAVALFENNYSGPSTTTQSLGTTLHFSSSLQCHVRYEAVRELGAGAFGRVFQCVRRTVPNAETRPSSKDSLLGHATVVAVKNLRLEQGTDGIPQWALREIALLKRCSKRHPNIISLIDQHYDSASAAGQSRGAYGQLQLVLEFCDMDLKQFIRKTASDCCSPGLPNSLIKDFLYQTLKGLDFLHIMGVIHRDIKPQNILLCNKIIKIADFGLGKMMQDQSSLSMEVVTLHYRPPEVLLNVAYSFAVDVWGVGCVFAEMCNNQILLGGDSEVNQLRVVFKLLGFPLVEDWPPNCSVTSDLFLEFSQASDRRLPISGQPGSLAYLDCFQNFIGRDGVDLMKDMLVFNPIKRITTQAALQHPYFADHVSGINYDNDLVPR